MNNRAIISDILLWVALALLAALAVYMLNVALPARRGERITVHFQDANEITRGSLVRMMGTEIGYVDRIRLKKDHVEVTVRTYPEALKIPSGAMFTVQFTGLVGAKSIEVVPPAVPRPRVQGKPLYLVEEPLRLKDNMNYQMDILQDLQEGAENLADFFGKKKPVEELQVNIRQAHAWTRKSHGFVVESSQKLAKIRHDLNASTAEAVATVSKFNAGMPEALRATEPAHLRQNMHQVRDNLIWLNRMLQAEGQAARGAVSLHGHLVKANATHSEVSSWMKKTHDTIAGWPVIRTLTRISQAGDGAIAFLIRADGYFQKDHLPVMRHAHAAISGFNARLDAFRQYLDRKIRQEEAREAKKHRRKAPPANRP